MQRKMTVTLIYSTTFSATIRVVLFFFSPKKVLNNGKCRRKKGRQKIQHENPTPPHDSISKAYQMVL